MPNWKYKAVKEFPIDKIPDDGVFKMLHAHYLATARMMEEQNGIRLPQWPDKIRVNLVITYSDRKDFAEHGVLEKEYKCSVCMEVETYRFHIRRAGEKQEVHVEDVIVGEKSDEHRPN